MRRAMMIELDKCVGCRACVAACKERWDSGPGARRDWVYEFEHGSREKGDLGLTFFPGLCNQCDGHPCTTECPTGATYADKAGVVQVDADLCIGCGNCVSMCPYSARTVDHEKHVVEKCNLCTPYLARGEQPACVQNCLASCRHVGDISDPKSEVSQLIRQRKAQPLQSAQVKIGPQVYYAPAEARARILAQPETIKLPQSTLLSRIWQQGSRPLAQYAVPPLVALVGLGGLAINLRLRKVKAEQEASDEAAAAQQKDAPPVEAQPREAEQRSAAAAKAKLLRHRRGMRFLHWFNASSWILLLLTGTALMASPSFALFGQGFAKTVAGFFGGAASLLRFHVLWGLLWAAVIVPFFLIFKRGGLEAVREVLVTRDDIKWLMLKPLVMLGLRKTPLPPQDKYNAGQKMFAVSALAGTTLIIATGLVMSFHLGSVQLMQAAILVHKLAVMLALVGLAVHITMAAIIVEERPALRSMIDGYVDREHAVGHAPKWVAEHEEAAGVSAAGASPSSPTPPRGRRA